MAGGFSFPPPPPPPPKPAVQSQPSTFDYPEQSGRGGRGRGGFESRGRGGAGRGRGGGPINSNFEPLGQTQRPRFTPEPSYAQPQEIRDLPPQRQSTHETSYSTAVPQRPPPGSYINPNFAGHGQDANFNANHQQDNCQANGRGNYGSHASTRERPNNTSHRLPLNDGPGRTQAGHKRKLDALRGPQQPREKRPGLQTAPSVPSFGAPILPPATVPAQVQATANPQTDQTSNRPKPASKTLGLTPKDGTELDVSSAESEGEDVDEEAQFAELGTKLTFEHNGEVMTLNNEADLAAWKEERRKAFPTSNRVSQKEEEMWHVGEERKRLLAAIARLHNAPRNRKTEIKTRSLREPSNLLKAEDATGPSQPNVSAVEPLEQKASNKAPLVQEVEPEVQQPTVLSEKPLKEMDSVVVQTSNDFTNDYANAASNEPIASQQEDETNKALPGMYMSETDEESDAEAGATAPEKEAEFHPDPPSDDEGPPEQVSSKPRPSAASDAQRSVCRYFSASGRCRDGDTCRFRHELSNRAPSARPAQPQPEKPAYDRYAPKLDPKPNVRKSIFERLQEQEEQGDDRLALQVIKALGQAKFFSESEVEVST